MNICELYSTNGACTKERLDLNAEKIPSGQIPLNQKRYHSKWILVAKILQILMKTLRKLPKKKLVI
ncbi:hypothetical protein AYO28_13720 [Pseudomonas putida]|uniref:Uncharacterized protein n=1 Tax=Pseudomonas putida TaxID=303 RepID=A0A177SR55_PSEPU|nr:hypothetical protein AYO28_13720 [Pseudomonas putida]